MPACQNPSGQWNLLSYWFNNAPDPGHASGISADLAWSVTPGRRDTVVVVLDSGVNYDRDDLANKIWLSCGELPAPQDAGGSTHARQLAGLPRARARVRPRRQRLLERPGLRRRPARTEQRRDRARRRAATCARSRTASTTTPTASSTTSRAGTRATATATSTAPPATATAPAATASSAPRATTASASRASVPSARSPTCASTPRS